MSLQEVEKEITDEQPGMRPKKRKITVMEYLYEQELEGECCSMLAVCFSYPVTHSTRRLKAWLCMIKMHGSHPVLSPQAHTES